MKPLLKTVLNNMWFHKVIKLRERLNEKNKINKSSRKRFVRLTDLRNKFLVFFLLININVIYLPHIIFSVLIFTLVQMKLKNLIKICQAISDMDVSTLI